MLRHPGLIYLMPYALPLLALAQPTRPAAGLQARGKATSHPALKRPSLRLPGALAPVQVPVDTTFLGSDGVQYRLSGTLTLAPLAPPPPPDPLLIVGLAVVPKTLPAGAVAVGTVTLSRAPGQAVVVTLAAEKGLTVDPSVTVQPGQATGTFSVRGGNLPVGTWLSVTATYNGQSKLASVFVQAAPPPPAAGPPAIGRVLNPDGSLLIVPQWGQEVRIQGSGFGTTAGSARWQGGLVPVASWSDTEVRVKLPLPSISGAQEFSVTKPDGTYSDVLIPGLVPGVMR